MPFSTSPVIGTIVMHPRGLACDVGLTDESDDSSLEALLSSLVQGPSPVGAGEDQPVRLFAFGRFSRFSFGPGAERDPEEGAEVNVVRADFARLEEELAAEYERLLMA